MLRSPDNVDRSINLFKVLHMLVVQGAVSHSLVDLVIISSLNYLTLVFFALFWMGLLRDEMGGKCKSSHLDTKTMLLLNQLILFDCPDPFAHMELVKEQLFNNIITCFSKKKKEKSLVHILHN